MKVYSYVPGGYAGDLVSVEVDIRRGIPSTEIVGLPDNAVREARERVRVAVRKAALEYPPDRVLINLAPAGVRKVGASFDLAIAVAVLETSGQLCPPDEPGRPAAVLVLGELQLDGTVRGVRGVLSAVAAATERGIDHALVPAENLREARALRRGTVAGAGRLQEAVSVLAAGCRARTPSGAAADVPGAVGTAGGSAAGPKPDANMPDYAELRGQPRFKRALELAAAGRHNLIVVGPPGSGKTMGVRALPSVTPDLEQSESLEVTRIYSRAGLLGGGADLFRRPPFRAPHHTASLQGIVGGGRDLLPGEISLAHKGVLFLDEAAEFRKNVLQSLREPAEERRIVIARAGRTYWYPADFQLVLAANPCPCGYFGHPTRMCTCSMAEVTRYWKRLGGPLIDRIDVRVRVDPRASDGPSREGESRDDGGDAPESSGKMHGRIVEAVRRQRDRYRGEPYSSNAGVPASHLKRYARVSPENEGVVEQAAEKLSLSSRAMVSVLRMARTLADLDASADVHRQHLLEAIQHRRLGEGHRWF
ncbi:MAG: YifB family Mg chelatase-like AAA ATPase [Spirochaetes bacterium]|nr:YifB family Mg chelatase-like AAA ATPase [Spirochaetota bacterium]